MATGSNALAATRPDCDTSATFGPPVPRSMPSAYWPSTGRPEVPEVSGGVDIGSADYRCAPGRLEPMRRRALVTWSAVLGVVCPSAAGCSIVHRAVSPSASASSTAPSLSAVVKARYVSTVLLDNGALEIDPPGGAGPGISASRAEAMFRAADAVEGDRGFAIFGLGVATVSTSVAVASAPSAPGTATTGAATPGASTSNTPASSTTTQPPSTTTTAGTAVTQAGVPTYDHRLAWVGIVWDAQPCGPTTTTHPAASRTSEYIAVLFDAHTGHDVLAYSSAAATCGSGRQGATVRRPSELVSVAWQPVAPNSTAVHATLSACSEYSGWTQMSGPTSATQAVEVVARVPYDPGCGSTSSHDVIVDDVVPLGSNAQAQLPHAAVGPVDALHTLAAS